MNIGLIFAGGVGKRMHSKDLPKQFLKIHDKPIIVHTLEMFNRHPEIDLIIVACHPEWIDHLRGLLATYNLNKVKAIVPGGNSAQQSIYNGLLEANKNCSGEENIVLIHDGVRPLITEKTISDNITAVKKHGSAITSVRVKETVLLVDERGFIKFIPNRAESRLARAPQSFFLKDILAVHQMAIKEGRYDFIDCCSMMQFYGKELFLIEGPQENIKITTPDDFYSMRAILDARENEQIYGIEE